MLDGTNASVLMLIEKAIKKNRWKMQWLDDRGSNQGAGREDQTGDALGHAQNF